MIQFIALRTWTSSNGGWVRFMVIEDFSPRVDPETPALLCAFAYCAERPERRLVGVLELTGSQLLGDLGEVVAEHTVLHV